MSRRALSRSVAKASGVLGLFAAHQPAASAIARAALLTMRTGSGGVMSGESAEVHPTRW